MAGWSGFSSSSAVCVDFSSHKRVSTGKVSLLIRSHVACVSNFFKKKKKKNKLKTRNLVETWASATVITEIPMGCLALNDDCQLPTFGCDVLELESVVSLTRRDGCVFQRRLFEQTNQPRLQEIGHPQQPQSRCICCGSRHGPIRSMSNHATSQWASGDHSCRRFPPNFQ